MVELTRKSEKEKTPTELQNEEVLDPTKMSDSYATKLGLKQYTSGFTVTGTNWTTDRAALTPYQMQDGTWRLRLNIRGTISVTASTLTITISGTVFHAETGHQQSVVAYNGTAHHYGLTVEDTGNISGVNAGNGGAWIYSGDVELDSKPTWAV